MSNRSSGTESHVLPHGTFACKPSPHDAYNMYPYDKPPQEGGVKSPYSKISTLCFGPRIHILYFAIQRWY